MKKKKKMKKEKQEEEEMLHLQWKERLDIDTAKLSTSRKCSRLKSLTLAASFELNTRFSREIKSSQNGGAFKIWKALMRKLHPFCGKRMIVRFVLLSESMYI